MSECARVLQWATDRSDTFDLGHPWVRNVLAYRGLGPRCEPPAACLRRFEEGVYSTDDVERVIELGLIGGGKSDDEAEAPVGQHVHRAAIGPNAVVAFEILAALFLGAKSQ